MKRIQRFFSVFLAATFVLTSVAPYASIAEEPQAEAVVAEAAGTVEENVEDSCLAEALVAIHGTAGKRGDGGCKPPYYPAREMAQAES